MIGVKFYLDVSVMSPTRAWWSEARESSLNYFTQCQGSVLFIIMPFWNQNLVNWLLPVEINITLKYVNEQVNMGNIFCSDRQFDHIFSSKKSSNIPAQWGECKNQSYFEGIS